MLNGVPPYKALLTHGFVVDGSGRKMSKSLGNVIAPQKVSDTLGAEILRLWVGATDYSGELSISDEILKRVVEAYRRIRNTLRFLLANLSDFDPAKHAMPVGDWVELDRYAVALAPTFQDELAERLRALRVPPRRAEAADVLLGGPRRVLPRRAQGPALHHPQGLGRAALRAERALSRHPEPAAADGADPVVHRRGGVAGRRPARTTTACSSTRGTRFRRCRTRRRSSSAGGRSAPHGPRCRRSSRRCARRGRSALRLRRTSRSGPRASGTTRSPRSATSLRFVMITSQAAVSEGADAIVATPSPHSEVRALLALPRRRRRRSRAPDDLRPLRRRI